MDKKVLLIVFILNIIVLIVLVGLVFVNRGDLRREYLLTYKHIPNTPNAKQIMQTIENAYDIETEAVYTFDLSKFSTVFINDPRFPLPDATLQVVREMTDDLSLESAGYLDYKLAYYSWRVNSTLHAEAVLAKAKTENRDLTDEERQSLIDKYGRTAPARPVGTSMTRKISIKFISMNINDDVSYVIIDDGPRTVELVLVLVDKQWYIAGIQGISIHP